MLQCHSGDKEIYCWLKAIIFLFATGEDLNNISKMFDNGSPRISLDVHGKPVGLANRSECYQTNYSMDVKYLSRPPCKRGEYLPF